MDRLGRADVLVLQTFRWSFEPPAASPVIWGMGRVAVAWGTAATGRGPDPVPVGWAPVVAVLRERVPGPAAPEAPAGPGRDRDPEAPEAPEAPAAPAGPGRDRDPEAPEAPEALGRDRDPEAPGVATPRGVWSSNDPFSSVSFQGSRPRAYG